MFTKSKFGGKRKNQKSDYENKEKKLLIIKRKCFRWIRD